MSFCLMFEVDTHGLATSKLHGSHDSFAQNMKIGSFRVGSEVASSGIAALSLVGTCTYDSAKRVEDTDMVTRPTELPR